MAKNQILRNQKEEIQALQDTIYVLGGKWRLPIINSICNGNKRFREIQRSIPNITTRMLSRELKAMELNNIIKKTVQKDSLVMTDTDFSTIHKGYSGTFSKTT